MDGQNGIPEGMTVVAALQPQDIQLIQTQQQQQQQQQQSGDNDKPSKDASPVALIKTETGKEEASGSAAAASITIPTSYLQNSTVSSSITFKKFLLYYVTRNFRNTFNGYKTPRCL